jgi:hypothetical protein
MRIKSGGFYNLTTMRVVDNVPESADAVAILSIDASLPSRHDVEHFHALLIVQLRDALLIDIAELSSADMTSVCCEQHNQHIQFAIAAMRCVYRDVGNAIDRQLTVSCKQRNWRTTYLLHTDTDTELAKIFADTCQKLKPIPEHTVLDLCIALYRVCMVLELLKLQNSKQREDLSMPWHTLGAECIHFAKSVNIVKPPYLTVGELSDDDIARVIVPAIVQTHVSRLMFPMLVVA